MAYASYSRGLKSGGINMSGLPVNLQNQPVLTTAVIRPERNITYELGLKGGGLNRRFNYSVNAFWIEVADFQATIVDSSQTIALRGYLSNIPEVTVKGFEAEAAARPGRLLLRGSLIYADGTYTDYPAGPCPLERQTSAIAACNLTGLRLAGLSKWASSLAADYEVSVGAGHIILHADSSWRSPYNGDSSLSQFTHIKGYNLTNGSIGYRWKTGLELALFARNLLNADYIQNVTIQAGNSGLILGTPSDPRSIGGTVRMRF
jgi:iron complex outermembrane receptor protein